MTPVYSLRNIRVAYHKKEVLTIERMDIPAGRITALTGPNGAGKSTFLALLAFLLPPRHGTLFFCGSTIQSKDLLAQRRDIGLVPQKPYFLRGSVFQNVELGLKLRGIPVSRRHLLAMRALEAVAMADFRRRPVSTLSGGEAQKIAIARALAPEPKVLLLDEPFSHLDPESTDSVETLILDYTGKKKGTAVFSSHDRLQASALADECVNLIGGKAIMTPLINLLRGHISDSSFDTGKIKIYLPASIDSGTHAAIAPNEIVISRAPLCSSMRNTYQGRVITIAEEGASVRLTVAAGEKFHVLITRRSLNELEITLGCSVWIHFKSTAVTIF